jgi:hypothetical protein
VIRFRDLLPLLVVLDLLLLLLLRLVNDDVCGSPSLVLPFAPFVAAFPSPICCALLSWLVGSSGTIVCGYRSACPRCIARGGGRVALRSMRIPRGSIRRLL